MIHFLSLYFLVWNSFLCFFPPSVHNLCRIVVTPPFSVAHLLLLMFSIYLLSYFYYYLSMLSISLSALRILIIVERIVADDLFFCSDKWGFFFVDSLQASKLAHKMHSTIFHANK